MNLSKDPRRQKAWYLNGKQSIQDDWSGVCEWKSRRRGVLVGAVVMVEQDPLENWGNFGKDFDLHSE